MALSSALGTVCCPPSAPLAPYIASLQEPGFGRTHAHPHLRNRLSFVLLPPDPSVNMVTLLSVHSDIGPRVSIVSNMGPDGVVSCSDSKPLLNSVRLFRSPLHLLYSAQHLLDF